MESNVGHFSLYIKKLVETQESRAYPHSRVQGSCNFVILLQSRAATQDLGKPELANGTLHVANLALFGSGRLDPL